MISKDRGGAYQPKIVEKHQRDISNLEDNIISLYEKEMSTRDINNHVKEIYSVDISSESTSRIINKLIPLIEKWQLRPLDPIYPFIFLDTIYYSIRNLLIASVDGLNGFDNA